ncbi:MAG: 50S ribosomal protein L6 [Rhodospirillales bacterium]|nr:50S ribosomal protein L6 [Rhodospirillales bacterium]
MSRVGNNPVEVPSGVEVAVSGRVITAKGKLGEMSFETAEAVAASLEEGRVVVKPVDASKRARALWGTTRARIQNMVTGVSKGFTRNLEINGVGYRATVQGNTLHLQLGYSHDINYAIPDGITIQCEKPTSIAVSGADKQKVGQVAAEIRGYRKPEPYKGKGIKYVEETILRKEGKKK